MKSNTGDASNPFHLLPFSPFSPGRQPPRILIVAGEASGDDHASRLVAAIREFAPQAEFSGIGGEEMAAQGVRILWAAADLAVVGLLEVVHHLPSIWRALRTIGRALKTRRPDLVILVDFPDFNFWVARLAKYYAVPVLYYISPQVWAWRTYRVRTIARLTDRMVVIFPFEADFYRQRGVAVSYVGHPFRETLPPLPNRRTFLAEQGLDPDRLTIALLPGSRGSEIERHLPIILEAAHLIQQSIPETQFLLPLASTAPTELVERLVEEFGGQEPGQMDSPSLKIIPGQAYQAMGAAHVAVVASGTATVEAALAAAPTVIVYRVAPLTFAVARRLIKVEHVGMANLLAGERLFPELVQDDFTPANLAREVLNLIADPERLAAVRRGLARVISRLGGAGASRRAAQVARELMRSREGKG
ncbi:MAG: lipid-A-disaccharide synthase [Syntrophobacterales bacterium]|jgi:lipid-A-disaccharide synthase|nr:lipid-A-disaccharide synthase [Syntrophobacterales bacterium]